MAKIHRLRASRSGHPDESGASLIEMMIGLVLLGLVMTSVYSSLSVVQERQVQVVNSVAALDNLQIAEEAINTDIHAATAWTTPAVPTSAPAQPITASWSGSGCGLNFTASINNASATIAICLNTTTHVLTVTCSGSSVACPGNNSGTTTEAQVSNIDSASLFTFTTKEVSTTISSVTTNAFFFTAIASTLTLDSPRVGGPHASQTTLTSPSLEIYNDEYACQLALLGKGTTGSC